MLAAIEFKVIALIGLGAAAALAVAHWVLFALRAPKAAKGPSPKVKRFTPWERLIMLATTFCLGALGGTGFYAALRGEPLHGWLLMAHVTFAPPFILGLLALVVIWAEEHRFEPHDMAWLRGHGCLCCGHDIPAGKFDLPQKVYFWLLATIGVLLTLSAVGSMLPLAGTDGQVLLYEIHRWSALLLAMAAILQAYNRALARPGARLVWLTGSVRLNWAKRYHQLWAQQVAPEGKTGS
jgi:formate dehydrogenase subunit gamma